MSSDSKKKTSPAPTKDEDKIPENQSTAVKRSKPNLKLVTIVVLIIIALVIIAVFAGWLEV